MLHATVLHTLQALRWTIHSAEQRADPEVMYRLGQAIRRTQTRTQTQSELKLRWSLRAEPGPEPKPDPEPELKLEPKLAQARRDELSVTGVRKWNGVSRSRRKGGEVWWG